MVTKLKANMSLAPPYVAWNQAECPQGQRLRWLVYAALGTRHWLASVLSRSLSTLLGGLPLLAGI